jgi:mannose-6-phosphate isomerase
VISPSHDSKEKSDAFFFYIDPNHKPELAIALTPFTALCGFRPLAQIATYLRSTPEFSSLIPPETLTIFHEQAPADESCAQSSPKQKSALKLLFTAVMMAPSDQVKKNLSALTERYSDAQQVHESENGVFELVNTLSSQFPGDVGVFCAFMLNYVKLLPGEAIFLGAGEPHAYISGGEFLACISNSYL